MRAESVNLEDVCVVVLTFNEEENIGRTLSRLDWAKKVIIVDSGSEDSTLDIAKQHQNVQIEYREFDTHAGKWNHALTLVPPEFEWVLALDADFYLKDEFIDAMAGGSLSAEYDGFSVEFGFKLDGRPIRCSVYTRRVVLHRRSGTRYFQDGHACRLDRTGLKIQELGELIIHDDRKPFLRWFQNQPQYAIRESDPDTVRKSRLRRGLRAFPIAASIAMFAYIYFFKLGILDGKAGLDYASRMAYAEFSIGLAQLALNKNKV